MGIRRLAAPVVILVALAAYACSSTHPTGVETDPAVRAQQAPASSFDQKIEANAKEMMKEGQRIFRYDTFGSEAFWGGQLRLHEAIQKVTARQALQLGLKVDIAALPKILVEVLKTRSVDLDKPETTLELLKANSVVGVTGFFDPDKKTLTGLGVQCALCHSTVDDSFARGIGRRLDGWPNRDLNVGAIVASAPTLKPFADLLGVDEATVRKVLTSWGPGKYDAELNQDGKAMRPDGKPAATVLPAAFGLAGVHLHTYTGWGSVTYWNAYVANTQMYGKGTFYDPRLADRSRFPVAARSGFANKRDTPDLISPKLAALHFYQLAIPAPTPPEGSYDKTGAGRGKAIFEGKARCATCHVPPLFTEPGWAMHTAEEIGIDDFQASRSPDKTFYRTTPLRGLFTRAKGGFYHDGRFADLPAVVNHYVSVLRVSLSESEKADLVEYLKSL